VKSFGSKRGLPVLLSLCITLLPALAGAQQISLTPSTLIFGDVSVGSSKTLAVVVKNITKRRIGMFQASVSGKGYTISGISCPVNLRAGQSMSFSVTFTPPSVETDSGLVSLVTDNWWKSHRTEPSTSVLNVSGSGTTSSEIAASPASVAFGNVIVGNSQTVPVTIANTGSVTVTISAAAATGTGFSFTGPGLPATLAAGQSTTFNAIFTPTSSGSKTGNLAITSDANNPTLNVPLAGVGVTQGQLTPNPASLSFGNVAVGGSKTLTETLTNSGGSSLTISAASASGTGFTLNGLTLPLTLTAGQSKTFNVQFAPAATGAVTGNVTITSDGANPTLNIPVSATGVAPGTLSANPTSLSFGNVQVGSNASLSETLTNTGGSNVTISQANVTGAGFSVTGLALPATLTPSQTVTFSVKFAPTAAGAISGNLAIVSDAVNSPLNIALSATGVTQGQITPNPASLSFGNVVVGWSKTLTETLTNSGGSSLTISAASVSGTGFTLNGLTLPLTLTAGQSKTFNVQFAPAETGAMTGNVTITSDGANPSLNIPVSGTGVAPGTLSANPTSLSFGSVQVGNTASLSETLTNTGGSAVTILQANVTGAGFSITGLTLPTTLNSNQSVTFTAKFAPTAPGAVSGNLAILSDGSNSTLNIGLSGTGTAQGQLSVSPGTLNFGNVVIGVGLPLPGSLTATGASVTVTSGSSNSSEFVLSGITFPKTIAAGQSASFTVTFTPNASGAASGSLTFLSNASNSPTVETLTGTGQAPQSHSVDLSWTASQSQGVVGYNIYRGSVAGGPYSKVNSTLNADTTYTDSTVTAGQTYFYVAKGVDGNDMESGPSNEVQATIPNP
jgi:hypothetical protein